MPRRVLSRLDHKGPIQRRLRGDAISCRGVQQLRPPSQPHQDRAPPGGVPKGLSRRVCLVPGRPFRREHLPRRDARAH